MFNVIVLNNKKETYLKLNENVLEGFSIENGIVHELTKEDIKALELLKLSSNKRYLSKENGYDVYLDNISLFKHYFKDSIEDIKMFCKSNSVDALLYKRNNNKNSDLYKFKINEKGSIILDLKTICLILGVTFTIGALTIISTKYIPKGNLTYENLENSISSNDNLTSEDKEIFLNEKLLTDIIAYYKGTNREVLIPNLLETTEIINQNEILERENGTFVVGWYNPSDNTIHVLNDEEDNFANAFDTKTHEYIHLLQSPFVYNNYKYIAEASAEIISYEYYNAPLNAYSSEVQNTKILMETVGPELIWKLNFSGDDTELKNIIISNLSEDKANRLLTLLSTYDEDYEKVSNNIHEEIRGLLEELYYNINNAPAMTNDFISGIYYGTVRDRYYFNSERITVNTPYISAINIRGNNDYKVGYIINYVISYDEYLNYRQNSDSLKHIQFNVQPGYSIKNDEILGNDQTYTFEQAYKMGILEIRIKDTLTDINQDSEIYNYYMNEGIGVYKAIFVRINGEYWNTNEETVRIYLENYYEVEEIREYLPNIYETFENQKISANTL